jgi:DNA-binding NtrC family response regulator
MDNNFKFFVIDDDPFHYLKFEQLLRNLGFNDVDVFDNGQTAVNQLTQGPDIILLDYEMTPINGIEVLKKIKRFNPDIYVILISAQEQMQVAINSLKYGAFDYIIKGDNDTKKLIDVIHRINEVESLLKSQKRSPINKLKSILKGI